MSESAALAAPPAQPAATVVLLRDHSRGGFEVHLQQRRAEMEFGASAHVFPGGSLDDADAGEDGLASLRGVDLSAAAARMHLDGDADALRLCTALHLCAVREVFEEAGLLFAVRDDGASTLDAEAVAAARERVLRGAPLFVELAALGARAQVEALCYVAHFITPLGLPRRYDTRFFMARAPLGQVDAFHAGEAQLGGWFDPDELWARGQRDEVVLMPPTRIVLAELRRHRDIDSALVDLGSRDVATIFFSMRDLGVPLPDHLPSVAEIDAWSVGP